MQGTCSQIINATQTGGCNMQGTCSQIIYATQTGGCYLQGTCLIARLYCFYCASTGPIGGLNCEVLLYFNWSHRWSQL